MVPERISAIGLTGRRLGEGFRWKRSSDSGPRARARFAGRVASRLPEAGRFLAATWGHLSGPRRIMLIALVASMGVGLVVTMQFSSRVREGLLAAKHDELHAAAIEMERVVPDLHLRNTLSEPEISALDEVSQRILPEGIRLKIWALDGTVLYADSRRWIGSMDDDMRPVLADVARTGSLSRIVDTASSTRADVDTSPVAEHYLALRDLQSGAPVAILESYQHLGYLNAAMKSAQVVSGIAMLSVLLMIATAIGLVLIASERVGRRQRAHAAAVAQRTERQRLVHELHDSLAGDLVQTLYAVRRAAIAPCDSREMASALAGIESMVEDAEVRLREFMSIAGSGPSDDLGLVGRLEGVVSQFRRRSGLRATLEMSGLRARLDASAQDTIVRATREALLNIQKHASARSVRVVLEEADGWVGLTVADDGVGWPTRIDREPGRGLGVAAIRHDAAAHHGRLQLTNGPVGAVLQVSLPVEA